MGGTINSYSILVATGKTSESHRNTENPRPAGHMGEGWIGKASKLYAQGKAHGHRYDKTI
jgi:hypothetical protein